MAEAAPIAIYSGASRLQPAGAKQVLGGRMTGQNPGAQKRDAGTVTHGRMGVGRGKGECLRAERRRNSP